MNDGKPSKEQLDYYFKTSRKYFDELANQYYLNDREYYDKYIAPYYQNFLMTSGRKPAGIKAVIFGFAATTFIGALISVFFLAQNGVSLKDVFTFKDEPDETETISETETVTEKKISPKEKAKKESSQDSDAKFDSLAVSYLKTDFEKASYFYGMKNYEQAEYYLKKIPKNDKDYIPAQEILKMVEKEKKEKSGRKKAIEKIN
ncbi:MAG: hypothetical protein K1X86_12085 [Ignavibacteria bacterium]|nr:hypothetical protein [Ignavibacteria bacterium]